MRRKPGQPHKGWKAAARKRHERPVWDGREGIEFQGRWYSCEELHRIAKWRMDHIDQLPRDLRDRLNEHGRV